MKKIFFILLLVCGMQLQAQKTLKIINLSATAIQIDDLITSTTTGGFPQYHTKQFGVWNIPAFGTFTLTNTTNATRFPFVSNPISVPSFNGTPGWERATSASVSTISPSNVAWIAGSTQVFYRIQITKGTNSKTIGAFPLLPGSVPSSITSNGWTASYVLTGTAPVQNYTITVQ
jgi:hypothetical protein